MISKERVFLSSSPESAALQIFASPNHSNEPTYAQIIGFDMGGTSTDVSRYAGTYEQVLETQTAGVIIQVGGQYMSFSRLEPEVLKIIVCAAMKCLEGFSGGRAMTDSLCLDGVTP